MTSRGGSAAPPYWTEWEWNEKRQLLRRELRDYKGRVLREQFGQPQVPRQSDAIEADAANNYYELTNATTAESPNESTGQWETPSLGNYGHQSSYAPLPPSTTSATTFGSQPRFGFPGGPGDVYGQSNQQPVLPGSQDSWRNVPSQHQAPGHHMNLPRSNLQHISSQTPQVGHSGPNTHTGSQSVVPTPPYQTGGLHGSGWPTKPYDLYGGSVRSTGSPGGQYYNSAETGQNTSPHIPQSYPAPMGNVSLPQNQDEPTVASQASYDETPSSPVQDETSNVTSAPSGARRQATYRSSNRVRAESNIIEPESERQMPLEEGCDDEATIQIATSIIATSKASKQQHDYNSKSYRHRVGTDNWKEPSKSHSRPPLSKSGRHGSRNAEAVDELAHSMRDVSVTKSTKRLPIGTQQENPPTSPSLDKVDANKSSTRAAPGYEREDPYDEAPARGDMRDPPQLGRRHSAVQRRTSGANYGSQDLMTDYFEEYDTNPQDSRDVGFGTDTFEKMPEVSPPQQMLERPQIYEESLAQQPMSESKLHPDFQIHHSREFKKGKVLKILWSEPVGGGGGGTLREETGATAPAKYGENAYHSVRRFVIVRETRGHSVCVPILTYHGKGTSKLGVHASDHAIIYTGKEPPKELPGEKKLTKKAVRVTGKDWLDVASRVNYSKLYTIEHNLRVCFIGKIHKDSEAIFFTAVRRIFNDSDEENPENPEKLETKSKDKEKKDRKPKK